MKDTKLEWRWDVLSYLIQKYNYKSYCEIGVQKFENFNKINCETKISVDPDEKYGKMTYGVTSDEYFEKYAKPVDLYFLDGLHTADQIAIDILNAVEYLNEGGSIICHDGNPQTKEASLVPRVQRLWNGDVYLGIVFLRSKIDFLDIFTIDTDHGLVVIRYSETPVKLLDLKGLEINYENFDANRKEWLNLISPEEALKLL